MRGFLIALVAGLVLASAGVAGARQGHFGKSSEVPQLVSEEPVPSSECAPSEKPDLTSESDGEEGEAECPSPDEEGDGDDEESHVPDVLSGGDRRADCEEAAGLSADDEPEASEQRSKGLDHAIEVVLANCIKNPQSRGLVNALRHLAANRDKHLARDEAKAERKALKALAHGKDKPKTHSP